MHVLEARLGPLRLPAALRPRTRACERVDAEGRFRFDVALAVPLVGFLVRYRGWLTPVEATQPRCAVAKPGAVL